MVIIARYYPVFAAILLLSDIIFLNLAFVISILVRTALLGPVDFSIFSDIMAFSTVVMVILLASFEQYKNKRNLFDMGEFISIAKSVVLTFFIVLFYTYISKTGAEFSRFIILLSFILAFFLIVLARYLLREILGILRTWGFNIKRAYIFKDSGTSKMIQEKIEENPKLGYRLTKSFDSCDTAFIHSDNKARILNLITSYPNVEFKIIPDIIQTVTGPAQFDEFVDIPLITIEKRSLKKGYLAVKRVFDIIASLLLLIITSPLFVIVSVINLILYNGVFFTQRRVGKGLKEFRMYKFKTMRKGKTPENEVDYLFKAKKDERVTWFGRILRRTCLDELPQLFNVLLGDMSLVGPRPHLREELHLFKGWKRKRFSVKPGLTGLWQVSGRHEINLDKVVVLDIYYINHMSLGFDIKIMLKTIPAIIFSRGIF